MFDWIATVPFSVLLQVFETCLYLRLVEGPLSASGLS